MRPIAWLWRFQDPEQCPIDVAPALAQSDPTFEQQATNLVDDPRAAHHHKQMHLIWGVLLWRRRKKGVHRY
jgi:hypothetical protein